MFQVKQNMFGKLKKKKKKVEPSGGSKAKKHLPSDTDF